MKSHRIAIWAIVPVVVSCTDVLSVEDRRPAEPWEVDRNTVWYQEVSTCLDLQGAPERVRWWYVSVIQLVGDASPLGVQDGNDIYIIPSTPPPGQPLRGAVHRHEAQHHILWRATGDPDAGHTHSQWSVCPSVPDIDTPIRTET